MAGWSPEPAAPPPREPAERTPARPSYGGTAYEGTGDRRGPLPVTDAGVAPNGWARLLGRIGEPPMNPLGNAEWANNASAALAHLALTSKFSETLERQIKLCMRLVDRISNTQAKAIITREIRELQQLAGIKPQPRPDVDRLVSVEGGVTLRAHCRLGPQRCGECAALARRINSGRQPD